MEEHIKPNVVLESPSYYLASIDQMLKAMIELLERWKSLAQPGYQGNEPQAEYEQQEVPGPVVDIEPVVEQKRRRNGKKR